MRWGRYALVAAIAAGLVGLMARPPWPQAAAPAPAPRSEGGVFAAPGRIEGRQVAVAVGAAATGIVREVLVSEGKEIAAGQVLARLECDDLVSEAREREAEARAAEAHADVVRLGPRREEIDEAAAEVRSADARLEEATEARRRSAALVEAGAGSRQRLDEAERDERMAEAQRDAAYERSRLLTSGARREEITEAQARAEAARGTYGVVLAHLARCEVRSPIAGTVLRKVVSAGELVSVTVPQAMFVVTDTSQVRIRAEVDEEDVGRLALGQVVAVVMPHWQGPRLVGRVVEVGRRMGRRHVMTDDPAERSDRDVLEALVEFDATNDGVAHLPIGLRVSVLFGDERAPQSPSWTGVSSGAPSS